MDIALMIGGVVALLALVWWMRPTGLSRATEQAMRTKDIGALVSELEQAPSDARPTAFNAAVKRLWDSYERPLAIELITRMAAHLTSASIAQYWIRHVLEVEPELAQEAFDADFLVAYYRPEVAAQCGKVG